MWDLSGIVLLERGQSYPKRRIRRHEKVMSPASTKEARLVSVAIRH